MASSNKTDNLKLPQWVGSDKPTMDDFNDAFDKIEGLYIQRGSASNGEWVKLSDGTLICYGYEAMLPATGGSVDSGTGLATSTSPVIPFPVDFIEPPVVLATSARPLYPVSVVVEKGSITTTGYKAIFLSAGISLGTNHMWFYLAIGRWK